MSDPAEFKAAEPTINTDHHDASSASPANPSPYGAAPAATSAGSTGQNLGKIRSTGTCILLAIVTFGIYQLVWWYSTHDEMKRHTGQGIGGGIALVLAFFVGVVAPFVTSNEVGNMYERAGMSKPVGTATGLWYFPGIFILVGPIVWFVKTNGAINDYWRAQGVS